MLGFEQSHADPCCVQYSVKSCVGKEAKVVAGGIELASWR